MKQTILGAVVASAALGATAAIPPAYLAHLPPEHHRGKVDYISGGTDPQEAISLKRAAQEFPLELVFGERDGGRVRRLRHVPITIADANGKVVFDGESEGPYFIARLPAGSYTVTTTWDEWTFSRPVTIGANDRERVVFEWRKVPGQKVVASR